MYRYAIIGFGGLGRVHLANLDKLNRERGDLSLCAICGTTAENFKKSVAVNIGTTDCSHIDISNCTFYDDYKELIDNEKPDFVVSALPTYLHEEVAVYALSHGVHILSEKPMALSVESCRRMINAANEHNAYLMIGQCSRFSPQIAKLKEYIDTGVWGKVYKAEFQRYSQTPMWTWNNWILDPEMSGGCIIDMHIHDVDLINYLFGTPVSVYSVMTEKKVARESIYTTYEMSDGTVILSRGDWSLPQKFPFGESCIINFEKACVRITSGEVTVYTDDEVIVPELNGEDSYMRELREFIRCITENTKSSVISAESVKESIRIALFELKSAQSKEKVML